MKENEIVLVEDNIDDANLTIMAFQKKGITILHLKDGEEALEYLFATGKYSRRNITDIPKVVLLDLKLPKIGGLEVLKQIKSNPITIGIPIVVLTSSKDDGDIIQGYKLGIDSYIVKPVGFENFSKVVSNIGLYWLPVNRNHE